ncbi:FAD-dependent oxidoreductase [Solirubrobacter ginsenosidimutans]|uniref:FAD-dependent oxidoreductase n=1 Tax=Solirubrobacter ginsenosidimutans TaxID=490573 RepID=A0A9X3S2R9_9ACTN|nr:FAD-dependent oxidoreductase [Solirubrobacter ginsenosidimutans]MDA0162587.1 FAD-dependent oxidoreductase [Solirubrobacter ginsenosidimutans]
MRVVIVGGGPAAFAAARGYRAANGEGDVTILTPELTPPYTRPALSKEFLRGELQDEDVPIEPAGWYEQHKIALRLGTEADTLDPAQRTITLAGGETLAYDACVLATGAEPKALQVPGATEEWVLLLRSLATARVLRDRAANSTSAVVVGSGFIGCEAAASLAMRGVNATLVTDEAIPHETRLGEAAGRRIKGWLEELGVELVLGGGVETISDHAVRVPGREPIRGDLVLMAAGVQPCAGLASDAGLELENGRVKTDAQMRTSHEHVYAAGDVAFAYNAAAERHLAVEHWGEALNMGEVAGKTIAGAPAQWDVAPGFWSTIGEHTLKYVAWGDGYDEAHLVDHGAGAFTVWYAKQGTTVGVLTHDADEDYENGRELIETKAPLK